MPRGPSPLIVAWSVARSLLTVRAPHPNGSGTTHHQGLGDALDTIATHGVPALGDLAEDLNTYLARQSDVVPDQLSRDDALAYWINLYNAGALIVAGEALRRGEESVLGVPGGFREKIVRVSGEHLSLDDVEHGKLRRFKDPRVHTALVCGSVSCPTLRREPYTGVGLSRQLDEQARHFLRSGGFSVDRSAGVVRLSRVFLWFGGDFVRPHRMPTFLPVSRRAVLRALTEWLDEEAVEWIASTTPDIEFQPYDWGLRCVVG